MQVHEQYAGHEEEWRYELRVRYLCTVQVYSSAVQVRYIPTDLQQLFEKDKVTFYYYYDQVSRGRGPFW